MNRRKSKALISLNVKDKPDNKRTPIMTGKKKLYSFIAEDGKEYSLTAMEKVFCELYLELQGNGTEAIIGAGYNVKNSRGEENRNLAKGMASEYLTKPNIFAYVTYLLTRYGFDSESVEKQHLFLINQFGDLSAKAKGIDMFYKVKGKYPKDQLEISLISKYKDASDEELKEILEGQVVKDEE